jgi:hypothetical protein
MEWQIVYLVKLKKKQFFVCFELKNKTELIIMCFVPVSYNTIRHY